MSIGALTGGCLCGAVRYAVPGPLRLMGYCHCSRCRRWTGTAHSTEVAVGRKQFHVLRGRALLRGYQGRTFCTRCGSSLSFGLLQDPPRPDFGLAAGTLDGDPGARPVWHIYVGSKAVWETIGDELPQFQGEENGLRCSDDEVRAARTPAPVAPAPSAASPVRGGCLCGGVRYELTGPFLRANHCHCTRCRRHSGSFGLTQGRIRPEHFRLVGGAELLVTYGEAGHAAKVFCTACGSSLFGGRWPEGRTVSIRLGSLDGDPGIRPQFHTFVGEKASWDIITDVLPQFPAGATREDMDRLGIHMP